MRLRLIFCLLPVWLFLLTACDKRKAPSMTGEDPVEVSDFIRFFPELNLPFTAADTLLNRKEKDSLKISRKVFSQFVPDSVLGKIFGKTARPVIQAIGKTAVPKGEIYLLVRAGIPSKKVLLLMAFDQEEKFLMAMTALSPDTRKGMNQVFTLDRKYTITRAALRKNTDGSISEGKEVFVLNKEAAQFMLILTEALEDKVTELINPIDTLPRKHKYAADYGPGGMNLVSVRDGRKSDRISFFIHIEKKGGNCSGELKGEARWVSPGKAVYKQDGDPCELSFVFSSGAVRLYEKGCGSRHGLDCSFEGSYARRKWNKKPGKK